MKKAKWSRAGIAMTALVAMLGTSIPVYAQEPASNGTIDAQSVNASSALERFEENYKTITGEENLDGLKARLEGLNNDITQKGILYDSKADTFVLTGYDYGTCYDWDLFFENIYQSYNGEHRYCFSNLDGFLARQQEDGFIARSFNAFGDKTYEYGQNHMFKPFIAQIALLGTKQCGDTEWIEKNFDKIAKYEECWYTRYDKDGNNLAVWYNADHSGMDNQNSRVLWGLIDEGVDLNCYLYLEHKAMAQMANMLGRAEDAEKFAAKAEVIKAAINENLWDEETGFFYDRREDNGQLNMVKGISGFTPMFAEITTSERTGRLVKEHLLNKDEFWAEYPIHTLARDEKDYNTGGAQPPSGYCNWNGTTWIPFNYMVMHGLMNYGYSDVAKELAYKTFELVYVKNNPTREYYNAETGEGYGRNPFYGWSSLAYLMPLEYEMGYNPADPETQNILPLNEMFGLNLFNNPNLAVSAKVTTSSNNEESYKIIDGFADADSTYWSNGADALPQTVTFSWDKPQTMSNLVLKAEKDGAPTKIKIEKKSGNDWEQIAEEDLVWSDKEGSQKQTVVFAEAKDITELRVTVENANLKDGAFNISEIGLYAEFAQSYNEKQDKVITDAVVIGENWKETIAKYHGTLQMKVVTGHSDPVVGDIKWSLKEDNGVATLDENGLLTAITNGEVVVVAELPNETELTRKITVSHQQKEVTAVQAIEDITVGYATDVEDIGLPETVKVTLSEETDMESEVPVLWNTDSYNCTKPEKYKLEGELDLTETGAANTSNLKATVNVIVVANEYTPSEAIPDSVEASNTTNGYSASSLTDGNYDTDWQSSAGAPIDLDFHWDEAATFNGIDICCKWGYGQGLTAFDLQIKDENGEWKTIKSFSGLDYPQGKPDEEDPLANINKCTLDEAITTTDVRIHATDWNKNWGKLTIFEVEFLNHPVVPVTGLKLDQTEMTVPLQAEVTLTAMTKPSLAMNKAVTWEVVEGKENIEIIKTDVDTITFKAIDGANAVIRAISVENPDAFAECIVTVKAADKGALDELIAECESVETEDEVFNTALREAKEISENTAATQEQVDAAKDALYEAYKNVLFVEEKVTAPNSVKASSQGQNGNEDNSPGKMVDGDYDTNWQSEANAGAPIELDFHWNEAVTFDQLDICCKWGHGQGLTAFDLQIKDENGEWKTIKSFSDLEYPGNADPLANINTCKLDEAITTTDVRIHATDWNKDWGKLAIFEVEFSNHPEVHVTEVSVNPSAVTVPLQKETTLTAKVTPSPVENKDVTWEVTEGAENIEIISQDANGFTFKAIKEGTVVVRATSVDNPEVFAECTVSVVANKDVLGGLIKAAEDIDRSKYTDESLAQLDTALENAKKVLDSENADQASVDEAAKALESAIKGLVEKIESEARTALKEAIKKAEEKDLSKYTDETVDALEKALEEAKAVDGNADATLDEIKSATDALNKALDGLKVKDEGGKPGDGDGNGGNGGNNGNEGNKPGSGDNGQSGKGDAVQTGDHSPIALCFAGMAAAIAAVAVLLMNSLKRRKTK